MRRMLPATTGGPTSWPANARVLGQVSPTTGKQRSYGVSGLESMPSDDDVLELKDGLGRIILTITGAEFRSARKVWYV